MSEVAAAAAAFERFVRCYGLPAPPVDVEELAASLYRLRVRVERDLARAPGAPDGTPLSALLLPARFEVWVRRDEPQERRRFSIAHEIGHFVLHAGGGRAREPAVYCRAADVAPSADEPARLREREANRFAAELVMPERLVRERAERDGPDPAALAAAFGVSAIAMGFRLVNLGYLEELPVELDARWRAWSGAGEPPG